MKRSIMFICIAMSMLFISCSKDKITQDNAMETLNDLLGYPCIATYDKKLHDKELFYRLQQLDLLTVENKQRIERGGSTVTWNYIDIANWEGLNEYAPKEHPFEACREFHGSVTQLCGFFPTHILEISEIIAVSEEVEGKVTVQFNMKFARTSLDIEFRSTEIWLERVIDGKEQMKVDLQRTETGWMVLESIDVKSELPNLKCFEYSDYENIEPILHYTEPGAQ